MSEVFVKIGSLLIPPVDPLKGGEWDYDKALFYPGDELPLAMLNSYRLEDVYVKRYLEVPT
jgi:hypothetical protein